MSKKKNTLVQNLPSANKGRSRAKGNKALIQIGLIVGILLFVVIGFGAFIVRENRPTSLASGSRRTNLAAPLSTPQYNANAPAKEYIYAGSKLLAVSEPVQPAPNDLAVWRLSTGTWWVMGDGGITEQTWGVSTDKPAPGDYDGDGKTDFCVFRPDDDGQPGGVEGKWYIIESGTSTLSSIEFGVSGDIPVPADFDGDTRSDLALYRPSTATWYIKPIASGIMTSRQYGNSTDKPLPSDFDGDGKADFALWRNSDATWYTWLSGSSAPTSLQWGATGDVPVPGDYDGDLKTDYAVWKPDNTWSIRLSSNGATSNQAAWGYQNSDWPVQGDYDGDGKTDRAVWRDSNGTWYIVKSSNNNIRVQTWGQSGDIPVPAPYRR